MIYKTLEGKCKKATCVFLQDNLKLKHGNAEWPFDGDITKEFHKGDELTFQFKIVEEYSENGIVLENTDYAKIAMKKNVLGKACKEGVDIYDYLVVD